MTDQVQELTSLEGWQADGPGARVHYRGEGDRYSIEFYAPSECIIYWKVPPPADPHDAAVPVARATVPEPLRERIRADLDQAGIDPEIETRTL